MENKDLSTAKNLLMMLPDAQQDSNQESGEGAQTNETKNIIPPVGIAHPELLNSFMDNMGDEDKLKQSIEDITNYHKENPLESATREVQSHGLRALEGLGGTVGGLLNLLSGEAHFKDNGEMIENEVPKLPSADELRDFTKKKTGEKFEPKGPKSKFTQEVATEIGANLPLAGGLLFKLLTPILGVGTKELLKHQGVSEKNAERAKSGIMIASTIANLGNAPRVARNAYHEMTNMVPQASRMATRQVERSLNNLRNQPWYRTGRTTDKGPAFDAIESIENAIQHGSMNVHDAMQLRRDISKARERLGAFLAHPGIDKAQARSHLDQVDEALIDGMETYGRQHNPNWWNAYGGANQALAVTKRSQMLHDYIQSHKLLKPLQSQTAKTVFHLGGTSALSQTPSILAGVAPVLAGAKAFQVINRMIRSPILRRHYQEVLRDAAAQNAGSLNRSLQKFDREAEKLEKKKKNQ